VDVEEAGVVAVVAGAITQDDRVLGSSCNCGRLASIWVLTSTMLYMFEPQKFQLHQSRRSRLLQSSDPSLKLAWIRMHL